MKLPSVHRRSAGESDWNILLSIKVPIGIFIFIFERRLMASLSPRNIRFVIMSPP